MRFALLFILATAVAARRGSSSPPSMDCKRYIKNHEYPFGWGLDDEICVDEMNCPVPCVQAQKVKEVNRVVKPVTKQNGWFGPKIDREHPMWQDIEEAMQGLE